MMDFIKRDAEHKERLKSERYVSHCSDCKTLSEDPMGKKITECPQCGSKRMQYSFAL